MKRIAVTGGGGRVAYTLLFALAHGDLFGTEEKIALYICDLPEMRGAIEAVAMELEDCAFPLLHEVKIGFNQEELFEGADCIFLMGAKPRGPGMERSDLLLENGKIVVEAGRAIERAAPRHAKVLVVGNPCNTNCLIAMQHAPSVPRENFHAMLRLDHNRAKNLLAKKAGVCVSKVKGVTVWGNHSSTQVPDYTHATIEGKPIEEVIQDREWLEAEFMGRVQGRGGEIIRKRGTSSAASASLAALEAMKSLYFPTPAGEWYTSGICSDDNPYGVEDNLVFGFPCYTDKRGKCKIVPDLKWSLSIAEKIALTQKELIEERECVKEYSHG